MRIIKGRTGEVRIEPGFWWVERKKEGTRTIVQVTDHGGKDYGVMFIGNLNWPDLQEVAETVEFLCPVPAP